MASSCGRVDIGKHFFTERVGSVVRSVGCWTEGAQWKEVWERILSEGEAVVSYPSVRIVLQGSISTILPMGNSTQCFN